MYMNTKKLFSILAKVAETSDNAGNAKLAAAVVRRGSVVSFGVNTLKTHPIQSKFGSTLYCMHAEVAAIKNALKKISVDDLNECDMYISRIKKDLSIGLSKPCKNCQGIIFGFGIKNVFYTDDENKISKM